MAEQADLVVGAALVDNILYADGSRRENIPGGAGLYALAGAALFSDNAVLITGTGRDLPQTFGPWLERNGLSTSGLRFADDHAPRNILRYIDEATRTETPVYGAAHFARIEPTAADVARQIDDARSIYIFRNTDPSFWSDVLPMLEAHASSVLWEIALDACSPQHLPAIRNIARRVEALSINIEEAGMIFETLRVASLIDALRTLQAPTVFLRAGARGSYVITQGQTALVPTLATDPVDVTGGGNAFGGGTVVGMAMGVGALRAAAMGSIAARFAISQYGPPEPRQDATRASAAALVSRLVGMTEQYA